MIRVMRIAVIVLLIPMAAAAQNEAKPTCVEVAKDIDKYADQEVTFYGKVNSAEVRDGVMVMVFACVTPQGAVIPDGFFGITIAAGAESFSGMPKTEMTEIMIVTGLVRAADTAKIFRSPPTFRGPYLYAPTFKPVG